MAGVTLSNFAPSDPPVVSTPERVYNSAIATKCKLIFCVPAFLEEWSQDPDKVAALQEFDAVLFGGAPIQKAVGDGLAQKGIRLYPFYGATELGGTSMFLPKSPPAEGWEYFKVSPHADPVFVDQGEKEHVYQLQFRKCESHSPAVVNTAVGEAAAYDTNDLMIRHPTNPGLWRIYGRSDDQIMHSTGEKTNPVPMETIMNRHPLIAGALIFGRGRFQAGVLIEPVPEHAFDPLDLNLLASFRNSIWPSVEEANQFAPSHSRIFKEMILVTMTSRPFQYTPKGTPKRHIILSAYKSEIESTYAAIEESSQTDIPLPESFDVTTCLIFVRNVVEKVMSHPVNEDDDIFQHGCDSLQATWIRNSILHALRQLPKIPSRNVPVNFVYLNPTIGRLGYYMARVANPSEGSEVVPDETAETIAKMNNLVEKYATDFPPRSAKHFSHASPTETVLVTGSTGGLGSYILEALVLNPSVSRIYALNRRGKANRSSRERQRASFEDRGIEILILESPKIVFLDGDASLDFLGLPTSVYKELQTSITCIIHSAWRVDFNVAISSMEPLIAGTRRLVDLALGSPYKAPPRLVFVSSIGVVRNWKHGFVPETPSTDAGVAVGSGYPESKWVAERVLTLASERTSLRPVIVRIGQLSGGRNGSWNPVEWVPGVVRSGQLLGCLPRAPGCISWIPVHVAALALVEMRHSDEPFLHLVHPNPVSWSSVLELISKAFKVPLVPYSEWLSSLEASSSPSNDRAPNAAVDNPALRLLDFYQSADKPLPADDAEAFGFPRLSTAAAINVSPSLRDVKTSPLEQSDVERWLAYWEKIGFMATS